MTKQQAIKELTKLGWTFVRNSGRFSVVLQYPANTEWSENEGVFDPRDLLEAERERKKRFVEEVQYANALTAHLTGVDADV
jgi:hypothetical protein